jgi:hypothetical protein
MQGVVECNTGHAAAGLARLTAALNEFKDRFAPDSPTIAALRARAGLCALQAEQQTIAVEMRDVARRAFTEQPEVSAFYKKPWIELEQQLGKHQLTQR